MQPGASTEAEYEDPINTEIVHEHDVSETQTCIKPTQASVRPRKRKAADDDVNEMVKQMKVVGENIAKRTTRDVYHIFGEYVANDLRELNNPKYARILAHAKYQINTALHHAEMERISIDSADEDRPISAYTIHSNPSSASSPLTYTVQEDSTSNLYDSDVRDSINENTISFN